MSAKDRILGTVTGEGFTSTMYEDAKGRAYYLSDGDIDADGANGQFGKIAAYRADNKGSEALANGGMGIQRGTGKVIFTKSWGRDIVLLGPDNQPLVLPSGIIPSRTWYRHIGKAISDPAAYLDSETENYIVVPPLLVQATAGIVRGCRCAATWKGKTVYGVAGDLGPRNKNGELSIAMARELGLNPDPRKGGSDKQDILYEFWPGVPAPGYVLQRA